MTLSDAAVDVHPHTALPPRIVITTILRRAESVQHCPPSGGLQVADPPRACLVGWGWQPVNYCFWYAIITIWCVVSPAAYGPVM